MISVADIEKVTGALEAMARFELSLSEFYRSCAEASEEDEIFWMNLAQAEINHAKNMERIKEILTNKRERFEAGRPFNLIAIKTALSGIEDSTTLVAQGKVTRDKLLFMARDIEQSILESRYAEIVKTGDIEYQTLMREIVTQTYEHRQLIQKAIDDGRT
ncbi:MAG: hypothetical protein ACYC5X_10570 [Syntrophales bacterium]